MATPPTNGRLSRCLLSILLLLIPAVAAAEEAAIADAPLPAAYFEEVVLPTLSRAGCNTAACHGAAAGRGGFRLSLFGGKPDADHREIVDALESRRVNFSQPERSLVLLKPTWQVDHEGGERFSADSDEARRILGWIAAGAPRGTSASTASLALTIETDGETQQLRAVVTSTTGESRDVTRLAIFTSADPAALDVSVDGRLKVLQPGRHAIIARYQRAIATTTITTARANPKSVPPQSGAMHWIDHEAQLVLDELQLTPRKRASDHALLRRMTLDLAGSIPTPQEVELLTSSTRSSDSWKQRAEQLLTSDDATDYWTWRVSTWLRMRVGPADFASNKRLHTWLREQIASDRPLDQVARELILAEGVTTDVPPANYHRNEPDARQAAEAYAQSFAGFRIGCANCHDHPLDRWRQDDYHGLAAIFAGVERREIVRFRSDLRVAHPATESDAIPQIPGGKPLQPGIDHRPVLVDSLLAGEPSQLAVAWTNRVWEAMFARGLVHPVDDLRSTNPASHPVLLTKLALHFQRSGYRLRPLLTEIAQTDTYARASDPAASPLELQYLAASRVRPLTAEVLLQAINDATSLGKQLRPPLGRPLPSDSRDGKKTEDHVAADELAILGRCDVKMGCSVGNQPAASDSLATQLHLQTGPLLNRRITFPPEWVMATVDNHDFSSHFLTRVWHLAYARDLTAAERSRLEPILTAAIARDGRQQAMNDLFWALLVSREFCTNH